MHITIIVNIQSGSFISARKLLKVWMPKLAEATQYSYIYQNKRR